MARELSEIRADIEALDAEMAILYAERMDLVKEVAAYKYEHDIAVFDPEREAALLEKNQHRVKNEDYLEAYRVFLQNLMDQSKAFQQQYIEAQPYQEK